MKVPKTLVLLKGSESTNWGVRHEKGINKWKGYLEVFCWTIWFFKDSLIRDNDNSVSQGLPKEKWTFRVLWEETVMTPMIVVPKKAVIV
jgi:hypothetical protein